MKIHNAHARKATTRSDFFFNYFTLGLVGDQGAARIDVNVLLFCFGENISIIDGDGIQCSIYVSEPVYVRNYIEFL